jgi:hypothetical protein
MLYVGTSIDWASCGLGILLEWEGGVAFSCAFGPFAFYIGTMPPEGVTDDG